MTKAERYPLVKVISRDEDSWNSRQCREVKRGGYYTLHAEGHPPERVHVIAIDTDQKCTVALPTGRVIPGTFTAKQLRQTVRVVQQRGRADLIDCEDGLAVMAKNGAMTGRTIDATYRKYAAVPPKHTYTAKNKSKGGQPLK